MPPAKRPRAKPYPAAAPPAGIVCHIEALDGLDVRGWAVDPAHPDAPARLHLIADGQEVAAFACDMDRPDLAAPHPAGFHVTLPATLADAQPHRLTVRDAWRREVDLVFGGEAYAHLDITIDSKPAMRSYVDGYRDDALEGWVMRRDPGAGGFAGGCVVRITCDGTTIGHARADGFRGDVARSTGGPSNTGFRFDPPASARTGHVRTFRFYLMPENLELENSPLLTSIIDDALQGRLARLSTEVDEMHRALTRIRRQLHELAPPPRHTIANWDRWFRDYEPGLLARMAARRPADGWAGGPLVSVVCPVYRPDAAHFRAAVASVLAQTYPHFELILVDDGSRDPTLNATLRALAAGDRRVRVLRNRVNLGISGAANAGLKAAQGAWVAFLDHDDLLSPAALECMVAAALRTGADMLYSDEDKIDQGGRHVAPALKPDWNHRLMLGMNYVCHLLFVRKALADAAGAFDGAHDGAQDHDYILRLSEHMAPGAVHHVPEVLYHWRVSPSSTAESGANKAYGVAAGARAVAAHLARIGRPARVEPIGNETHYTQTWLTRATPPVTIVIPYKDQIEMTARCVETIRRGTDYPDYDIVLVDNWSTAPDAAAFARRMARQPRTRVLRVEEPFNYSRLNNLAVAGSTAEFYMFMNNDLFPDGPGWLRAVVGEATVDPAVGAVGGKFTYPDGSIQHGGVIVGFGGVAGHAHTGRLPGSNGYGERLLFAQEMSAVTAAGVLVRAAAFHAVGGFDEQHLRVAFNDVDLCLKLRRAGHTVIWTPAFTAEHRESLSRGDDERPSQEGRFFDEIETMKARWGAVLQDDPFYNPNFALDGTPFFDLRPPV